jgi:hypothetical protein
VCLAEPHAQPMSFARGYASSRLQAAAQPERDGVVRSGLNVVARLQAGQPVHAELARDRHREVIAELKIQLATGG